MAVLRSKLRKFVRIALVASALALAPAPGNAEGIKVTLLGTGRPPASMDRFEPSTLVEAGGRTFLVDAGRGALLRLDHALIHEVAVPETFRRANLPPQRVTQVLAHHTLPEQAGEQATIRRPPGDAAVTAPSR